MPGAREKPKTRRAKPFSDERLLELGRKHFAEDFPNLKRKGCPPKNQLKLLAERPRKAKESVLSHISFCSPCYKDFRRFLQARKKKFRAKSARAE